MISMQSWLVDLIKASVKHFQNVFNQTGVSLYICMYVVLPAV